MRCVVHFLMCLKFHNDHNDQWKGSLSRIVRRRKYPKLTNYRNIEQVKSILIRVYLFNCIPLERTFS